MDCCNFDCTNRVTRHLRCSKCRFHKIAQCCSCGDNCDYNNQAIRAIRCKPCAELTRHWYMLDYFKAYNRRVAWEKKKCKNCVVCDKRLPSNQHRYCGYRCRYIVLARKRIERRRERIYVPIPLST